MITVLVVDDHSLVTDSLRIILENESDIRVIATAYDGYEALEKCKEVAPDVVLMDIKVPLLDGIESASLIKKNCPGTKVAVLTSLEDSKYVMEAISKGADAYLFKDTPPERLKVLIQCIHWGFFVLSDVARELLQNELINYNEMMASNLEIPLKDEDIKIIRYLGEGKNNREIGELLGFAEGTIKNKITRLISHLNVENRAQLVLYAFKKDLF